MPNEKAILNGKNRTKTIVEFYKDQLILTGKILSHDGGKYVVEVHGKQVQLDDSEVDHVNTTDEEEIFRVYLTINMSKTVKYWTTELAQRFPATVGEAFEFPKDFIETEHNPYDIDSLVEQLLDHAKNGIKDFQDTGRSEYPYYPLAYVVVLELLNKLFGGFMTVLVGTSPLMEVMVMMWLHGYLMSSAVRKQVIKTSSKDEEVSKELIEEKEKELKDLMEKMVAELDKYMKEHKDEFEQGDENHGED